MAATGMAIFALVAGGASLAVRAMHHEATVVAKDTLPGLMYAGEASERMHANWHKTCALLDLNNPEERARDMAEIVANSTEKFWQHYQDSIFDPYDASCFQRLEQARSAFLGSRSRFFELVQGYDRDRARKFLREELDAAFAHYRDATYRIFALNASNGQERASRILRLSHWTPWLMASFCLAIFLIGAVLGFQGAIGALVGPRRQHPRTEPPKPHQL